MFDIINKYSKMKVVPLFRHEVVGKYNMEEALIDAEQTGVIWQDGRIMITNSLSVGDSRDNIQMKGYISFDISELHGKTVLDTEIVFTNIHKAEFPEEFASIIDVKVFYYDTLDATDFEPGGVRIATIPISATSYSISNDTLKNELQKVLDHTGREHFQLKLGLNATTNNDDSFDYIYIYSHDIALRVRYIN